MPPVPPLPPFPWFDVVVILMLIALNGVFAMAEMAIVSSRKPRLKAMAKVGAVGRPDGARPRRPIPAASCRPSRSESP